MHLLIIDAQNGFTTKEHVSDVVKKTEQLLTLNVFDHVMTSKFINTPNSSFEQHLQWSKLREPQETAISSSIINQHCT